MPARFRRSINRRSIAEAFLHAIEHPIAGAAGSAGTTVKAIFGQRFIPGVLDRYLASDGVERSGDASSCRLRREDNLDAPLPGDRGAHGSFDREARVVQHRVLAANAPPESRAGLRALHRGDGRSRAGTDLGRSGLTAHQDGMPPESRTTRSSATADPRRWSPAAARSTGCAGRGSTARRSSRRCSTPRPAATGAIAPGGPRADDASLRRRVERARHRVRDRRTALARSPI